MKILVTGGAGYIGSVLVPKLLAEDHHVTIIDSLLFGSQGMIQSFYSKNFNFVKGDVRDEKLMASLVAGADLIIHLAAYVGYPICKKFPKEAEETNLGASLMLNKLRGSTPILFGSTGSNYGQVTEICTEETPLNPITLYGTTKTGAERAFVDSGNQICYRFATAFGPSPRLRLDLLINDFCNRAVTLKSLIVYEAEFRRTFIHVEDIANSFMHAIANYDSMKDEVYNVGSNDMNFTKAEIARLIQQKVDYYLHFADVGQDEDQRDYEVDYTKFASTGFKTKWSMDDGLDQTIGVISTLSQERSSYSNV